MLNVHFHTLVLDGVFTTDATGATRFDPAPPPTDREVARLVATIARRVERVLRRRGLVPEEDVDAPADPMAEDAPALAALSHASVMGRSVLGRRPGAPVLRVGRDPDAPWVNAHLQGFDLHANRTAHSAHVNSRKLSIIALLLVVHSASLYGCSATREVQLSRAVASGNLSAVRDLLAAGANPNWHGDSHLKEFPPLVQAIRSANPSAVRALLDAGANPDYQESNYALGGAPIAIALDSADSCEREPLGCEPYAKIVQSLIDAGADIQPPSKDSIACDMARRPAYVLCGPCNYATCALGRGKDEVILSLLRNGLSLPRDKALVLCNGVRIVEIDGRRRDGNVFEVLELAPGNHVIGVKAYAGHITSDIAMITLRVGPGKQYKLELAFPPPPRYTTVEGPGYRGYTLSQDVQSTQEAYRTQVAIELDREGGDFSVTARRSPSGQA